MLGEILMFPRLFPSTPDDEFCDYIICCFLLIVIMLYICEDGNMNMKLLCEIVYLLGFILKTCVHALYLSFLRYEYTTKCLCSLYVSLSSDLTSSSVFYFLQN